jgi:hypothetical protein
VEVLTVMASLFMGLVIGLVVVAAVTSVVAVAGLALRLSTAVDVSTFARRYDIPLTDASSRLVGRYLARSRRYRANWCLGGMVAATAIGVSWYGRVYFGFNTVSPIADVVLMGLGAWFTGLMQAEAYNRRARYHGPRVASLDARSAGRYRDARLRRATRAIAVGCGVVSLAGAAVVSPALRAQPVVLGMAAIAVITGAALGQRGIVGRARVVTSPDLMAADEAIRSVAAATVDLGASGVLLLVTGSQLSRIGVHVSRSSPATTLALTFVSLGLLATSLTLAWRARRLVQPSARQRAALAGPPIAAGRATSSPDAGP